MIHADPQATENRFQKNLDVNSESCTPLKSNMKNMAKIIFPLQTFAIHGGPNTIIC